MPIKYSDNNIYGVDPRDPHILFIKKGNVHPHSWITPINVKAPAGMIAYGPKHKLNPNDCLVLAEAIAINIPGYKSPKCVLKEHSTDLVFGYTDKQNIKIAKANTAILNENANPDIGDAYAIVRNEIIEKKAPYHIAYVIFKDGDTTITMEADAENPDLEYPMFDMYNTKNKKQSFHSIYSKLYSPASTIILKKR